MHWCRLLLVGFRFTPFPSHGMYYDYVGSWHQCQPA
jgi:hypothetical protein